MSRGARVDSESPRRLIVAVRRLLAESERAASSAVAGTEAEALGAQKELFSRERQLAQARRRLAQARAVLAGCRAQRNADCSAFAREVAMRAAEVRQDESRVRVAREVLAELRRQHDRIAAARQRLVGGQNRNGEAALRELAVVAEGLDTYLSRPPAANSSTSPNHATIGNVMAIGATGDTQPIATQAGRFSSGTVAQCWSLGLSTLAGRAYYEAADEPMRKLAAALKPVPGTYTIDMHGAPSTVSVGDRHLAAQELAELVRADPGWRGNSVCLFSCYTGHGDRPIAQDLATALDVRVTAPKALAWSNRAGDSWVAPYEWKMVGGTVQRVPGAPQPDGWRSFDP